MLTRFDQIISGIDHVLRTVFPPEIRQTSRPSPAQQIEDYPLSFTQKKHCAGLMRVNHAGEVCAQALYHGHALTAKSYDIKQQMIIAAEEETDHLAWCEQRLSELDAKPSVLNPLWYCGSFFIGAIAGLAGDAISLGFVVETERQVALHLQKHLQQLPHHDQKTKLILETMLEDEEQHAHAALKAGAMELPFLIKRLMGLMSLLMTRGSYYL